LSSVTSGRPATTVLPGSVREGRYELDFARTSEEIEAVLRLRFEVFNLELGEGLDSSYATGRDEDPFDAVCHHLLIRDTRSGEIVGSYRMQTAEMAARNLGFYSDTEYDLSTLPSEVLAQAIEIGRACVAASHRSIRVLFLLWKGLGLYGRTNDKRYLFGCSSVKTQDPHLALQLLEYLRQEGHVHSEIEVPTRAGFECPQNGPVKPSDGDDLPDLIRIYLHHGAKICSSPAIDRDFKTVDFLMLFDVHEMPKRMVRNFVR
jgi:putative hemolysin